MSDGGISTASHLKMPKSRSCSPAIHPTLSLIGYEQHTGMKSQFGLRSLCDIFAQ